MVAAMKGFVVNEIDTIGDPAIDWYDEFTDAIVARQATAGYWARTVHGDDYTTTAWALLTLLKAAGVPPGAAFYADPEECFEGDTVTFHSEATGDITSWTWDFGDGSAPDTVYTDDPPVTHAYDTRDVDGYSVTLTVTNDDGSDSFTIDDYVKVYEQPVAAFSGTPLSGIGSLTVDFTDESTGDIDTYEWDFDGNATTDSTDASPSWTYSSPGVYSVSLTVGKLAYTDCETKTDYVTVYVPAVAAFSGTPTSGIAPYTVAFTDASSGAYDTWDWSFGDGGSSAAQNPSYEYVTPGLYDVTLTVTGNGGSDAESKDDYITVYAPAGAAFAAGETEGVAPFTANFTNLSGGDVDTFVWDFGDVTPPTAPGAFPGTSHTYTVPGVYTVILTASGDGGSDTETKVDYITVYEPPVALFEVRPGTGDAPLRVCFTDLSTGDVTSWAWDFDNDGEIDSTQQNPCHTYVEPGVYEVTLTVGILDYSHTSPEPMGIIALKPKKDTGGGPAQMGASYLLVDPQQVLPGQEVSISANACNNGGSRGSYTVSLSVNGATEQSQSLAVSPGSCKQVVFKVAKAIPGTYQVTVNGMYSQFSVLAPRTVQASVPSQQDTGLGTWGIAAIAAVALILIVALVVIFRRS